MRSDPLRWRCSGDGWWRFLGKVGLGMGLMVDLVERRWRSCLRNLSEVGWTDQILHAVGKAKDKEEIPFRERERREVFLGLDGGNKNIAYILV